MGNNEIQKFRMIAGFLTMLTLFLFFAGNLNSETVNYTYDPNGRLLKADYGGGKSFTYTYDKAGNILTETVASPGVTYTLQVTTSPTGGGSVTGGGINCPGQCTVPILQNQGVVLTAAAQSGFKFLGWGGNVSGTTNPVTVTMNAAKSAIAYFGSTSGSTDTDGVTDLVEMGPGRNNPSYDGNGDGIPDYEQSNVASLPASTGGAYVTIALPQGQTLANVNAVSNPSPGDMPSVLFPYGFFEFEANGIGIGGCTTVTLYLPLTPWLNAYYKYGATPDNHTAHWYEFMYDGTTGAQILHDASQTRIMLHFCDGQRGDDDIPVDALIVDQGGPGAIQDMAYVSTNGLCSSHSPCSSNIHTAVTSASHPSVINITQENYTENIALAFDQAITLAGGWNANFTSNSGFTTIQGSLTITHGIMILENIILK